MQIRVRVRSWTRTTKRNATAASVLVLRLPLRVRLWIEAGAAVLVDPPIGVRLCSGGLGRKLRRVNARTEVGRLGSNAAGRPGPAHSGMGCRHRLLRNVETAMPMADLLAEDTSGNRHAHESTPGSGDCPPHPGEGMDPAQEDQRGVATPWHEVKLAPPDRT